MTRTLSAPVTVAFDYTRSTGPVLGRFLTGLREGQAGKGIVDLADDLYGEHFELLRDRIRFADFYLDYGLATIAWHHGVDFAPDYLYDKLSAMH